MSRAVDVPIIGCGGISRGTDVIEMAMAGASAVQVCTAAILRGNGVFEKIVRETAVWLGAHGYTRLEEVRGMAGRAPVAAQAPGPPIVDVDLCNGCALCEGWCVYDAIHIMGGKAESSYTRRVAITRS
jgi:dihydropyrimidine dehydrogenase (NAD+) subunit PreA